MSSALAAARPAESIREFLGGLSITGVPQPLAYLIDRTAGRHGLVRVSLEPETGRTIVSSPDHHLVATIAVDQSLRAVGLVADGALLRTRADWRAVFWALSDERYPVVAIDEAGRDDRARSHRMARMLLRLSSATARSSNGCGSRRRAAPQHRLAPTRELNAR